MIDSNSSITNLEAQLDVWRAKLDELAAKAEVASREGKRDAHKFLDQAKVKLEAARVKLDEAKRAGAAKWSTFETSVQASWKDLETAFRDLTH